MHGGGIGGFVEHNRKEYYAQHHIQEIEFEISRQVVATLVGEGPQAPVKGSARMRGLARHELFPQVLRLVRRYVAEKVDFRGANPCELALERYVLRIKERLLDAIVPDEEQGETPILPVLNRYKPIGATSDVDFTTKRNIHTSDRSHINAIVLDKTGTLTKGKPAVIRVVTLNGVDERALLRLVAAAEKSSEHPLGEAVVAYAYAFLRKAETDPIGDADAALKECDTRLAEIQDAYLMNNNFQGFILPDVQSSKYNWE